MYFFPFLGHYSLHATGNTSHMNHLYLNTCFYGLIYFWPHQVACRILIPPPGIQPAPPVFEAWSLNHWTTREVLKVWFWREAESLSHARLFAIPLASSVHGILQARILEWVPVPFIRASSQPRDWTQVSHIAGRVLSGWATRANWGKNPPDSQFKVKVTCPLLVDWGGARITTLWSPKKSLLMFGYLDRPSLRILKMCRGVGVLTSAFLCWALKQPFITFH